MHLALKLHPDSSCAAVTRIDTAVLRPRPDTLVLHYIVTGAIDALLLPLPSAPARADELWKHTCFEAFIRPATGEGYGEFNFAPSTQWAAYRFDNYRSGTRNAEIAPPRIEVQSSAGVYELQATFALAGGTSWRLGLSAVIEETSGNISYWALAHPPGKPDFHHADGFAYDLPATEQT